MKRAHLLPALVLLRICWLPLHPAAGQEYDELELRAYPYADLLIAASDYPYDGQELPTVGKLEVSSGGWGGVMGGVGGMGFGGDMGMGGMGMGAMGMGMGMGGMEPIAPGGPGPQGGGIEAGGGGMGAGPRPRRPFGQLKDSPLFNSPDSLIQAITKIVAPETWEQAGGAASVAAFGGLLLISQTPQNHEKIDDLLKTIRSEGATAQTVVVEASWLLLDANQLRELLGQDAAKPGGRSPLTIDPAAYDRLSREVPGYCGRITCFSGQTVHLVSGNRRSVVMGAIPVVGSGIGYQPIMSIPNAGVVLQVTPSLLPGNDAAILDVRSTVTGWVEPEPIPFAGSDSPATERLEPASQELVREPGGASTVTLDRLDFPAQQLATTLRVPLDRPVVVGGLTHDPTETAPPDQKGADRKVLYLVVQVSAVESRNPE